MNGTPTAPELLEAARQGDNRACEQVLEENAGLIWSIVRRYYGRGVEPDDLYQLGCLGFLKASKPDPQAHGFGIKSIEKIVHNYNGNMQMYYDGETFTFHTIIMLKMKP